jgi:hypothetical protein
MVFEEKLIHDPLTSRIICACNLFYQLSAIVFLLENSGNKSPYNKHTNAQAVRVREYRI